MKKKSLLKLASLLLPAFSAQLTSSEASLGSGEMANGASKASYTVVERGPHHRVIRAISIGTNVIGNREVIRTNSYSYTELETGMHRKNAQGEFVKASDGISPAVGGAATTNAAHTVFFAGNANSEAAIQVTMPTGGTLTSHVLCLSYFDPISQTNAIIAELTDSIGQIINGNEVLYTNALVGDCVADILYHNSKAGIEQNIILRTQPPDPAEYGISNARLQVWSEFVSGPAPRSVPTGSDSVYEDEQLDFGGMMIGPGKAFLIGNGNEKGVRVTKQWVEAQGRTFLVEQVPLDSVAAEVKLLPVGSSGTGNGGEHGAISPLLLKPRYANGTTNVMQLAKAELKQRRGFLLDYNMANATNFIFQADTTYYLSGSIVITGSNVFEGGCVLKYATNASLNVWPTAISSTVYFFGSAYRPITFTAKDDQTVGAPISGSANSPSGYYANSALYFAGISQSPNIAHIRVAYAKQAIGTAGGISVDVSDAQFVNCSGPFELIGAPMHLRNVLFANCLTNLHLITGVDVTAEHVTFSGCDYLVVGSSSPGGCTLELTNCILANVTNLSAGLLTVSADTNGFWNSPTVGNVVTNSSYPFQTAGGGSYYLANSCRFAGAGTTNININLLAGLRQKTTQPPVVIAGRVLTTNDLTLSQEVLRESAVPDLGYAYEPIDYEFGAVTVTNAVTITVTNGTVIAGFGTNGNGKALTLYNSAQFITRGSPTQPIRVVEFSAVQEQVPANWGMPFYSLITDDINEDGNPPALAYFNCRFTDFSVLANDTASLGLVASTSDVHDCQFHGGAIAAYGQTTITNCLFERGDNFIEPSVTGGSAVVRNSLFFGGNFYFDTLNYTNGVVDNNLFDRTTIAFNDATNHGNNAYVTNYNRITPTNASDIILASVDYASGPLGTFYYPTTGGNLSRLINAGSASANALGLYHFTVTTNLSSGLQIKETNSVVDIGFHYVAVDSNGKPIDTDSDGLPDYFEDTSGDGTYSTGDLANWNAGDTDGDGVSDYIEYLQGRNPRIANIISDTNGVINLEVYTPLK